ncbi:MAG: redoxin domain-containing protein [Bryobacterales bacterium]|nr:redoxin domain-containing protein [Bryobacterales bacterium]MBV9397733.1 redoxin domain-containing protein [Bryobacterales bacterium]
MRWPIIVLSVLLFLSLSINVLQGRRVLSLEDSAANSPGDSTAPPDSTVPPFEVSDLSGVSYPIEYDGRGLPKVLYIFSPSCSWCVRNTNAANSLKAQISTRYEVIGLSLQRDRLPDFLKHHQLDFSVYTGLSEATRVAYRLGPTPTTIVVAADGTVLKSWTGAYVGATKSLVESYFGIHLPD